MVRRKSSAARCQMTGGGSGGGSTASHRQAEPPLCPLGPALEYEGTPKPPLLWRDRTPYVTGVRVGVVHPGRSPCASTESGRLRRARTVACRRETRSWTRAAYLSARAVAPLSAGDMAALGDAAWWEGAIDESLSACEEAYRLFLHGDDRRPRQAAMLAIDIGISWYLRGEEAMGSGWISQAQRLLESEPECVEHGYLQSLAIDEALAAGNFDGAIETARAVAAIGARYEDETLCAYALVGEGIALIKQGYVADGLAVLDEAMLPVVAGRVRPTYAGSIYCQLMSMCHELADLRRAHQWTDATARWCEGFDSAVMFLGVCRVHRAQLLRVRGEWSKAEAEIARVCRELAPMNMLAVGLALYELGEAAADHAAVWMRARRALPVANLSVHRVSRSSKPRRPLHRVVGRAIEIASAARSRNCPASSPRRRALPCMRPSRPSHRRPQLRPLLSHRRRSRRRGPWPVRGREPHKLARIRVRIRRSTRPGGGVADPVGRRRPRVSVSWGGRARRATAPRRSRWRGRRGRSRVRRRGTARVTRRLQATHRARARSLLRTARRGRDGET